MSAALLRDRSVKGCHTLMLAWNSMKAALPPYILYIYSYIYIYTKASLLVSQATPMSITSSERMWSRYTLGSSVFLSMCVYLAIRDPYSLHLLVPDGVFDAAVPGIVGWVQVNGCYIRNRAQACLNTDPYSHRVVQQLVGWFIPVNKWAQVFLSFTDCS